MNLPRLKALPSADDPLLVYLGPGKDGKTAMFMVDASLRAPGRRHVRPEPGQLRDDRRCTRARPSSSTSSTRPATTTAQYQLDLIDIKRSTTASAAKAKQARAKASKAGRRVLRAHQSASGPLRYRYDTTSGTVRKLPKRTYKALLAKTARAALGTAGGF